MSIIIPTMRGVLSGFSPLSLSPALWLDAADPNTLYDATTGGSLVAADGLVARWEDKSGNGRHATQAVSQARPVRKTNTKNGRDVIRFDSMNDCLECYAFNVLQPFTVYSVFRASASSVVRQVISDINTSTVAPVVHRSASGNVTGINVGNGFFPIATITDWQILRTFANGSLSEVSRNGASASVGNAGENSISRPRIGNVFNSDYGLDGDIAEILIFPTALSTTNRQRVERYLGSKWGITIA